MDERAHVLDRLAGWAATVAEVGPCRVQLRRTAGWRMPPNTVKVARPSAWGNPFRVGGWLLTDPVAIAIPLDAHLAVELYRAWAERMVVLDRLDVGPLAGRNLACWCSLDRPCHADVLLGLANR